MPVLKLSLMDWQVCRYVLAAWIVDVRELISRGIYCSFVGLVVSDNVAFAAPLPATSAQTSAPSKKRKAKSQLTTVPVSTSTQAVPASTSTAIVPATSRAVPSSTEIVPATSTCTEIIPVSTDDAGTSSAIVAMDTIVPGADTLVVGSNYTTGTALVNSALRGLNTRTDARRGKFKEQADFVKAREDRSQSVEAKRRLKRMARVDAKCKLGSPKQPGQDGYVQQQVANKETQAQVQQAVSGL